ncbi:NYN domain-containing protein [Miniimonas arenae]|uniref:NYN domain-containing protein n=1 Tax=Miniimonas arenae TaxID=676201 RepID=A0A5C5BBZ4_9MICO|nr:MULTISPECIES: NYN domain-containing protein [Miniimonas]TNU73592.1 NYN domain-containing protein [Miniimonas arenae]
MEPASPNRTYLLVDGENIDATLGMSVLGRRPAPEERPRWERVNTFAQHLWNQPVTALFFLNASSGQMPMGFVQALLALGYHPIPLSGSATEKVVDIGIQRTLEAIAGRGGDVLLASHDGDFLPQVETLLDGEHRVGLLAFREFANAQFTELTERGLTIHDLEDDLGAFNAPLPRVRIIPISAFDPLRYL